MLAWVDAEALAATLATGEVHFHSRSRGRLWRKGETSGNVLRLQSIELDCDGDALLLTVDPVGPTCHRGNAELLRSARLDRARRAGLCLARDPLGDDRRPGGGRPAGSYTAGLLDGGVDAVGRKVTEEATEVLLAAKDDAVAAAGKEHDETHTALAGEAADLLFHALVLLAERDLAPAGLVVQARAAARRPAPWSVGATRTIR